MRIGLYGIGLDTYWPQFNGLRERLGRYQEQIAARLSSFDDELVIINAGMVDTPEKAREAGDRFAAERVDLIFLYISTYALSSTVLPVVQRAAVPVVVLNLQPVPQIDYEAFNRMGDRGKMTGEWLANCQACSAPEIACVFNRVGIDYHLVSGHLEDKKAWGEIREWLDAARVRAAMRNGRMGVLGHYYCGMLDVYSDLTQQAAVFGTHFELLEMCELHHLREQVGPDDVAAKIAEFCDVFEVAGDCEPAELERAARTSVALDRLASNHQLDSMAYYYEGQPGNPYENIVTSIIPGNTLLTSRHLPVAGECEIKNAQAMKIMDLLGAGGSFSEFYLSDFVDDVIYFGHDGPAHPAIAEGRVGLVPLPVYHGKPGRGLSIQMTVRHGPVTLVSVVQQGDGCLMLLVAEGESVDGPVLNIGNTNSRYRFSLSAADFMNAWCKAGPAHHCAIGVGHVAGIIEKIGNLMKIKVQRVC